MSAQPEIWRVSTVEGVFEADVDTLRQWILEGCVQPTDKVTKGNMNWIDAGKAPMLRAAFAGERVPIATPTAAETHQAVSLASPETTLAHQTSVEPSATDFGPATYDADTFAESAGSPDYCENHPDVATKYVCWRCIKGFCEACANFVAGSRIPLCAMCGDLSGPLQRSAARSSASSFRIQVSDLRILRERCVIRCSIKWPSPSAQLSTV